MGDTYTDSGATVAGDDSNGVASSGTVNTSAAGTYTITYTSTDDAGNTATAARTVIVVEPVSETTITITVPEEGIGSTSAALNVSVTTLGKDRTLSDYGYIISTSPITDATGKQSLGAKNDLEDFATVATGLEAETLYYVCPYATQGGITALGEEKTFTTQAAADDTDRLYISPVSVTETEANTDVAFTVTRIGDTTGDLDVTVTFSGTAAETSDYTVSGLTGGTLTIPAGDASAGFTVSIVGDTDYEGDETVEMALGAVAGYAIISGNGAAALTIADDDVRTESSECAITAFALAGKTAAIAGTDITLSVIAGTDLTDIAPDTLTVSADAAVSPSAATLRDFSSPVIYTVTAEDGTTARYTVTVSVTAPSSDSALSGLAVKDGSDNSLSPSPVFQPDTTSYTLDVGLRCQRHQRIGRRP